MALQPRFKAEPIVQEFHPLYSEASARPVRTTQLEVIQNQLKPGSVSLGPQGSIVVFVGSKGSNGLANVRRAIAEGGPAVQEFMAEWKRQIGARKEMSIAAASKLIASQPVFAELRYGGTMLVNGIWVPEGLDCAILVMPYNGGALAPEGFTLAEYYKEGTDAGLEAIVLQTAPPLTAAEAAALKLVPADQLGQNIGKNLSCDTTYWAVASVVCDIVLLVVALATAGCSVRPETNISQAELDRLGPAASARMLLGLRRDILNKMATATK